MNTNRMFDRFRTTTIAALLVLAAACDPAAPPQEEEAPSPDSAGAAGPAADATAPAVFRVRMETSKGPVVIELHRDWAPMGVDRFYTLVQADFFSDARFFRVLPGFVAQFGIPADPQLARAWDDRNLQDDPVKQGNRRGTLTYASMAPTPHTRSTQLFINLADNPNLDGMGFAAIGEVVEGMSAIDSLFSGYGEGPPYGTGPDQGRMTAQGNTYLQQNFPQLDYIRSVTIVR